MRVKQANLSNYFKRIVIGITGVVIFLAGLYAIYTLPAFSQHTKKTNADVASPDTPNYKVTFVELGSLRCIPCKAMQPVMKSIEKKYGRQVKIIFHDVWTPEGKEAAKQFVFTVIPTQIFLDSAGKEYYRHEGFFPEEEVVKVLKLKGVR